MIPRCSKPKGLKKVMYPFAEFVRTAYASIVRRSLYGILGMEME